MKFTTEDLGCYAEGASGHDHVRATLAELVRSAIRAEGHARTNDIPGLILQLQGEMSDDASEEDEAIELLTEYACEHGVYFTLQDGDLVLVAEDIDEEEWRR